MVGYELHLPLSERETKKRHFPKGIAGLVVYISDRDEVENLLSEFIHGARMSSRHMIAQSMTMFMSSRKLKKVLDEKGLRYHFDSDINTRIRHRQNVVVDCLSERDITSVLKGVDAEAIVFYGEAEVTNNPGIQEQLIEAGRDGYTETPFLKLVEVIPYFIFYSSTHASIEILGTPEVVKSLFLSYCGRNP